MSFSRSVKDEILKLQYENACCEKAMLYGLCLFAKSFTAQTVAIQTEHAAIAERYRKLLLRYCRVKAAVKPSVTGKSFSVLVAEKSDCEKILRAFGHDGSGSLKINFSNFDCEGCAGAFLAGAFLACGTVSDPAKDYHLEFSVTYHNLSKSLVTLLEEQDVSPKAMVRKGSNVVYFKDSQSIEDCLYIMGAASSMFDMMRIEVVKDFRNKANRTANCEAANIDKTVRASYDHLAAIELIRRRKGLAFLKPDLREIAVLRMENPEASLADLARLCGMSRSGVNHRLKRIVEIAQSLDSV